MQAMLTKRYEGELERLPAVGALIPSGVYKGVAGGAAIAHWQQLLGPVSSQTAPVRWQRRRRKRVGAQQAEGSGKSRYELAQCSAKPWAVDGAMLAAFSVQGEI